MKCYIWQKNILIKSNGHSNHIHFSATSSTKSGVKTEQISITNDGQKWNGVSMRKVNTSDFSSIPTR